MENERRHTLRRAGLMLGVMFCMTPPAAPASDARKLSSRAIRQAVDAVIPTLMAKDRIPGMAIAVTAGGKAFIFNYGVASMKPRTPVTNNTCSK